MQPRKNRLLRIKFNPSKDSEMPLEKSGDDNRTQAQLYDRCSMQYFMMRVANFESLYLKQFWVKIQNSCAHWTGNFLNFSKPTQLLSVAHFLRPLGAFEHKGAFFLGHPVVI